MLPPTWKRQGDEQNNEPQKKIKRTVPGNPPEVKLPMMTSGQLLQHTKDRFRDMNNYSVADQEPVFSQFLNHNVSMGSSREVGSNKENPALPLSQLAQDNLHKRSLAINRQLQRNKILYEESRARVNQLKLKKKFLEEKEKNRQEQFEKSKESKVDLDEIKQLQAQLEKVKAENKFYLRVGSQEGSKAVVPLKYPIQSVHTARLRYSNFLRPEIKFYNIVNPDLPKPKKLADHLLHLQFLLHRFMSAPKLEKENFDYCLTIFQQLFPALRMLCEWIQSDESKNDIQVFTRDNYQQRHVDLISKQINFDMVWRPETTKVDYLTDSEGDEKEKFKLLQLDDEFLANKIKLIGILSVFVGESCCLCEMIASRKISTLYTTENLELYSCTVLELITKTIAEHLIPLRTNFEYRGLTHAFSLLAVAISKNYTSLTVNIDESLCDYFKILLVVTTNNADVLVKLSEFVINIGKTVDSKRLFSKLCKNCNVDRIIQSKSLHLIEMPKESCHLMILFQLTSYAFSEHEDVVEHRIEGLFQLTENINKISYLFLLHANNVESLKSLLISRQNGDLTVLPPICSCLKGIIYSLVSLNNLIVKNNLIEHPKYRRQSKELLDTCITLINDFFKKNSLIFHLDPFILNKLQCIYVEARYAHERDDKKGSDSFSHSEFLHCPLLWKHFEKSEDEHGEDNSQEKAEEVIKKRKDLLYDGIQIRKMFGQ